MQSCHIGFDFSRFQVNDPEPYICVLGMISLTRKFLFKRATIQKPKRNALCDRERIIVGAKAFVDAILEDLMYMVWQACQSTLHVETANRIRGDWLDPSMDTYRRSCIAA
eukprot:scaffold442825_cov23-Prasinocladus_malaysianus.AAC.1